MNEWMNEWMVRRVFSVTNETNWGHYLHTDITIWSKPPNTRPCRSEMSIECWLPSVTLIEGIDRQSTTVALPCILQQTAFKMESSENFLLTTLRKGESLLRYFWHVLVFIRSYWRQPLLLLLPIPDVFLWLRLLLIWCYYKKVHYDRETSSYLTQYLVFSVLFT